MALTRQRHTFDEWVDSPENTALAELVEGIPVERMATTPDHGRLVRRLEHWLSSAEEAGLGEVHVGPVAVVLDATGPRRNVREPDLCFVRADRASIVTEKAIEGLPDLVIDVLSPSNRADDLPGGDIWKDYERFGVPRYWIVDPGTQTVAQYEHHGDKFGPPTVLSRDAWLQSDLFPGLTLPVAAIFASGTGTTR